MPIPWILAGLGIAAGAIGAGGHLSAKETNERAQRISEDAQELYNNAKVSLERSQVETEASLLDLGYSKKKVLETSIKQFLQGYDRIKHINFKKSVGVNEVSKFTIEQQDAVQLREMSDIYQSTFSSGATGAAAGAVVALAASGSLPIVTGVLSTAGTALMAGEVTMAAGLAGSALSFGAAMTPLAAIAAPALLFTGISSSIKADENLEKSQTMYAEAEAAAEQMKISETLCTAITKRADMFDDLLGELNVMFSECTRLLDGVTRKKTGLFSIKKIDANDFTEEELKLIAVTRALAGAVKAVIDTPILSENGALANEAESLYEDTANKLPVFREQVNEVESLNFNVRAKAANGSKDNNFVTPSEATMQSTVRNIFALIVAAFVAGIARSVISDTYVCGSLAFVISTLLIMNTNTDSKVFNVVKNIAHIIFAIDFCILLYANAIQLTTMKFFLIIDIILGFVFLFIFATAIPNKGDISGNFKKMIQRVFSSLFFLTVALLVFDLLTGLFGFSLKFSIIVTEVLFVPFAFVGAYISE